MSAPWALYRSPADRSDYDALSGTVGSFERHAYYRTGGKIDWSTDLVNHPSRDGAMEADDQVSALTRRDTLVIETKYVGTDTGTDITLEMMDEYRALVALLNPKDSPYWIRLDRNDGAGSPISYERLVRVINTPEWQLNNHDAKQLANPSAILEFDIQVLYMPWVRATEQSQAFTSVGTSYTATSNLVNGGANDAIGLRIVIDAKTGAPTKLYVNNTLTGMELIVTCPLGFTAGDEIDFFGADPRDWLLDTANPSHFGDSAADADCRLDRGTNPVKLKVDSGTVNATLYWRPEELSP